MTVHGTPLTTAGRVEDLEALLRDHGVPVERFGTGDAKTVSHLLAELRSGEASLHLTPERRVLRRAHGVTILIQATDPATGRWLRLVEDHQRFHDGRVRRRSFRGSLGEKMVPGEDPARAAARALVEELGVRIPVPLTYVGVERTISKSRSYPGLITAYEIHAFTATLPEAAYRPDGYVERQHDKQTVFRWQPVS